MPKIIIVDDDEQSRIYLEDLFKFQNFDVVAVANGALAMDAARKNPPHIIISDILMPVMDGFMLCREWKKDEKLKNIPFVFYTATYTDSQDEKLAMDIGADLFLIKPCEPDVILRKIGELLAQRESENISLAPKEEVFGEEFILKRYNFALFHKLESKVRELEKANLRIQESESKYRSIFLNSLSGIFHISENGKIINANPSLYQMLGYNSFEDLIYSIEDIGKQLYVNPEEHAQLVNILRQHDCVTNYLTRLYKKNREVIWIKANVWTIRDSNRNVLYYEGTVENITDTVQKEQSLKENAEKLENAMLGTISVVASIVEQRDPYTAGHQYRVADLCSCIAKSLNFSESQIKGIQIAGMVHDVGKVCIPSEILSKPTRLSPLERKLIEAHCQVGYNILKKIDFPWPVLDAVLQHHERINGSGYPSRLKDSEISLEARIIAVADVVEAMSSHRPYRPSLGVDKALEEIERHKGVLFDKDIVDTCVKLFRNQNYMFVSTEKFF
jgi:PAS domain S-box-containing protein